MYRSRAERGAEFEREQADGATETTRAIGLRARAERPERCHHADTAAARRSCGYCLSLVESRG